MNEEYQDQVEGRNAVLELLESGKDINKIFKNIKNKYNHALFINVVKACSTVIHCITGFLLFQKCQTRGVIFLF